MSPSVAQWQVHEPYLLSATNSCFLSQWIQTLTSYHRSQGLTKALLQSSKVISHYLSLRPETLETRFLAYKSEHSSTILNAHLSPDILNMCHARYLMSDQIYKIILVSEAISLITKLIKHLYFNLKSDLGYKPSGFLLS